VPARKAVKASSQPASHPAQTADLQIIIDDVVDHSRAPIIVMDFDKTISAWDAGGAEWLLLWLLLWLLAALAFRMMIMNSIHG
jgi:hypothetical protein